MLPAVADLVAEAPAFGLDPRPVGLVEPLGIAIDLEQGVLDRVVEPGPLGLGQLILIAPEDRIL